MGSERDDSSFLHDQDDQEGNVEQGNAIPSPNKSSSSWSSSSSSSSLSDSSTMEKDNEGLMTNVSLLIESQGGSKTERKISVKSNSSGISHESFHSTMNEDVYLLHNNPYSGKISIENDASRMSTNNAESEISDTLILLDQQSLEGDHDSSGVVYMSGPSSGKTRNGYQRYNSCHSQTKGEFMDENSVGSGSNSQPTREGASISSSMSLPTSNELRQRVGVNNSNNINNTENRTRYSIHHGLHHSNRVRSFTSPDTRSPSRYHNHNNNNNSNNDNTSAANNRIHSLFVSSTSIEQRENQISPQRSLLNSLDSGMTALRRWMVNRASQSINPRPSRAAQVVQRQVNDEESNYNGSEISFGGIGSGDGGGGGGYDHYAGSNVSSSGDRPIHLLSTLSYNGSTHSGTTSDECLYSVGLSSQHDGAVMYPQTIQEEDEHPLFRQRANSEPERSRWTSAMMMMNRRRGAAATAAAATASDRIHCPPLHERGRRMQRESLVSDGNSLPPDMIFDMESSGDERLNRVSFRIGSQPVQLPLSSSLIGVVDDNRGIEMPSQVSGNAIPVDSAASIRQLEDNIDPLREARRNWIRINRIFQLVVTLVGLIFSFLLFSIMVTWVVLTSAYVVSIDEVCDLPLKTYFWLATIQLMLDVFRKEIMRFVFRFDPSRHRDQIPTRVIFYNLAYLTYAMLVLRLGITSIFLNEGSQCPHTAKKLFNTTRVFVSISIAAWLLVLFGYLIPFCIVAILLTRNGYSPASEQSQGSTSRQNFGVFPLSHVSNGAPPRCIDRMKSLSVEEFREDFPRECCVSEL